MKKWDWLRDLMQKNGITQQQAADALQWKKTRISELLSGKRDLPVSKVYLAARFFNLDLEELIKYNSGFSTKTPSTSRKNITDVSTEKITSLTVIDSANVAGKGLKATHREQWPVNAELLRSLGMPSVSHLKVVIARGDAMSPTINDRDFTLVDISVSCPKNDGIYLFEIGGELFIKRIRFNQINHTVDIISDNSLYPPINIDNQKKLTCLGKIIAIGKMCR